MKPPVAEKTWICPTPADRARVLDMERRLKPVRVLSFLFIGAALAASVPWIGTAPLAAAGIALLGFVAIDRGLDRARRPEYHVMAAWALSVALVTAFCLGSGGVHSPFLAALAIPAVTLPARFRPPVVAAGGVITVLVVLAIAFGTDATAAINDPVPMFIALAIILSVIGFTLALMRSDLDHRSEAFIDPLTGMLNRHALKGRVSELAAQAEVNHQPIALILVDLDHFKAINDEHGHETGDAVLREAAYRIRVELRAYDLAYRLGGEEFLVVMPGADIRAAEEVADALRRAVSAQPMGGVEVTMSLGVSASSAQDFDYTHLFARADKALYEAKRSGRNRVSVAHDEAADEEAPSAPAGEDRLPRVLAGRAS